MNDLITMQQEVELAAAYRHCEKMARASKSNFFFAFYSLPRQMFREMCVLYAFMRVTDDLGDDPSLACTERRKLLQQWRSSLLNTFQRTVPDQGAVSKQSTLPSLSTVSEYATGSAHPVLLAIVDVALRRNISPSLLEEVITGVESDLHPREFRTFEELNRYCYQVAGVVGICCLHVWGTQSLTADVRQLAIDCGTAFQLTNILRDISEDAQRGRLYLPVDEITTFGLTPAALEQGVQNETYRQFMQFQVERTWDYYRRALPLLEQVSPSGRPILTGFLQLYSSLLNQIERRNYDVFTRRIRLSRYQKLTIGCRSLLQLPGRVSIPAKRSTS